MARSTLIRNMTVLSPPTPTVYHLSLSPPFTPDLKPICSTNPFLHRLSGSNGTAFTNIEPVPDLLAQAFVCLFLFLLLLFIFGYVCYTKLRGVYPPKTLEQHSPLPVDCPFPIFPLLSPHFPICFPSLPLPLEVGTL